MKRLYLSWIPLAAAASAAGASLPFADLAGVRGPYEGTGAGGAFVTAGDLVKFWKGLISHKLLSETMVKQMFSKKSGDGEDAEEGYYGYGVWIIDNPEGEDLVYMQGSDPGVSAITEYNPNNGMISVLLSNYGDNVWARMRKIRKDLY